MAGGAPAIPAAPSYTELVGMIREFFDPYRRLTPGMWCHTLGVAIAWALCMGLVIRILLQRGGHVPLAVAFTPLFGPVFPALLGEQLFPSLRRLGKGDDIPFTRLRWMFGVLGLCFLGIAWAWPGAWWAILSVGLCCLPIHILRSRDWSLHLQELASESSDPGFAPVA